MIQLTRSTAGAVQYAYLDIYDKMTNTDYRPLFTFTSQATGYSFTLIAFSADYTDKERYVSCSFLVGATFSPLFGAINFGNTAAPYGFYDFTVYQNSSNSNLLTTGLNVIYNGLANFSAEQTGNFKNPAVEYTDYSVNDSDTESVYITF